MLFFYRLIINFIFLATPIIIIYRIFKKKEDPKRFLEKIGKFNKKITNDNLIWFHGSSVGEILSIVPLIEKLGKRKNIKKILITTNTLSSAKIIKKLKLKKTFHQFFPLDTEFLVEKFLNHWKPKTVFFIESEIWPNMIIKIKEKNIPLILLNARITKKSFKKWSKILSFSKRIFNEFDLCLGQNDKTCNYLKILGARNIKKIGNLKFSQSSLELNSKPSIKIKSTGGGAHIGGSLDFITDEGDAGASGDVLGTMRFIGDNADQDIPQQTYAQILGKVDVATDGEESGILELQVANHDDDLGTGLTLTASTRTSRYRLSLGLDSS